MTMSEQNTKRQTGRTQRMIDALIASVNEGAELCVVVTHNRADLRLIRNRIAEALSANGLPFEPFNNGCMIGNQFIDFVTYPNLDRWRKGKKDYKEFFDHFVYEFYECRPLDESINLERAKNNRIFSAEVEFNTEGLPTWKPNIVIDDYRLEDDGE
jgi:hypothetical protein